MTTKQIWVVDDDQSIRRILEKTLQQARYDVRCFAEPMGLLSEVAADCPDLIISDIRMPGVDGIHLLRQVRQLDPRLPVIIMTAYTDLEHTVAAFDGGAFEYLAKPFDVDEVVALVRRALRGGAAKEQGKAGKPPLRMNTLIGRAPAMQKVFSAVGKLSRSDLTVLITGESGTGKELIATALHQHSQRASSPMLAINTAAIPAELLESELFGHEKGAFTGATERRIGRFEQADGGTLFLDEIGDMSAAMQTRLLRILAEGEFYRVGGQRVMHVDVRVIAATHQELERRVREGSFREDLLHRLAVVRVRVPPLRERREDIAVLARHFLVRAAAELQCPPKKLLPDTAAYMETLPWPGNVRQLENVCRWLTVMAPGHELHRDELPAELVRGGASLAGGAPDWQQALTAWAQQRLDSDQADLVPEAVKMLEATLIRAALHKSGGRLQRAAQLLGWGRNTLNRKLREHDIE